MHGSSAEHLAQTADYPLICIIYHRVFQHCQINLRSLFRGVAHALADDRDWHIVISGSGCPAMA